MSPFFNINRDFQKFVSQFFCYLDIFTNQTSSVTTRTIHSALKSEKIVGKNSVKNDTLLCPSFNENQH